MQSESARLISRTHKIRLDFEAVVDSLSSWTEQKIPQKDLPENFSASLFTRTGPSGKTEVVTKTVLPWSIYEVSELISDTDYYSAWLNASKL